jgi:hypothetical protein
MVLAWHRAHSRQASVSHRDATAAPHARAHERWHRAINVVIEIARIVREQRMRGLQPPPHNRSKSLFVGSRASAADAAAAAKARVEPATDSRARLAVGPELSEPAEAERLVQYVLHYQAVPAATSSSSARPLHSETLYQEEKNVGRWTVACARLNASLDDGTESCPANLEMFAMTPGPLILPLDAFGEGRHVYSPSSGGPESVTDLASAAPGAPCQSCGAASGHSWLKKSSPTAFTLVLTDARGQRLYGFCIHFYQAHALVTLRTRARAPCDSQWAAIDGRRVADKCSRGRAARTHGGPVHRACLVLALRDPVPQVSLGAVPAEWLLQARHEAGQRIHGTERVPSAQLTITLTRTRAHPDTRLPAGAAAAAIRGSAHRNAPTARHCALCTARGSGTAAARRLSRRHLVQGTTAPPPRTRPPDASCHADIVSGLRRSPVRRTSGGAKDFAGVQQLREAGGGCRGAAKSHLALPVRTTPSRGAARAITRAAQVVRPVHPCAAQSAAHGEGHTLPVSRAPLIAGCLCKVLDAPACYLLGIHTSLFQHVATVASVPVDSELPLSQSSLSPPCVTGHHRSLP